MANRKVTVLNPAGYQEQLQPGDDAAFDSSNITLGTDKITLDAGDGSGKFSGVVESTSGGFKFPDGTTQTTAGGSVDSVNSKTGDVVLTASDVGAIPTGGAVTKITAGSNITISPTSGTGNVTINSSGSDGIPEAPIDGKQYGRQSQSWTEIISSGGGGGGGDSLWQQSGSTLSPIAGANSISLSGQVSCGGEIILERSGQSRFVFNYAAPTASTVAPTITSDGSSLYYYGKNGTAGEHVFYSGPTNEERLRIGPTGTTTFAGAVTVGSNFTVSNGITTLKRDASSANPLLYLGDATTTYGQIDINGTAKLTQVKIGAAGAWDKINLDSSGAASFAGGEIFMTSAGNQQWGGEPYRGEAGAFTTLSGTVYCCPSASGNAAFSAYELGTTTPSASIQGNGNATFRGDVAIGNSAALYNLVSDVVTALPEDIKTTFASNIATWDQTSAFVDGPTTLPADTPADLMEAVVRTTTAGKINLNSIGSASFASKVGIGVVYPVTDLHVSKAGSPAFRLENTSDSGNADIQIKLKTNTFNIGSNSTANYFNDIAGSAYIWYQAGNEVLRIDTAGDISATGSADVKQLNITRTLDAGTTELIDLKINGSGTGPTGDVYGIKADLTSPNTAAKLYGYYIESKAGTGQSTWGGYASAKANSSGQSAVGLLGEALVQAGAGQTVGSTAGVKGIGRNFTGPGAASKIIGVMAENLCDSGSTAWGFYGSTQTGAATVTPLELIHDGATVHKVEADGSASFSGRVDAYADGDTTGKTTPAFTTGNGAGASVRNAIFPDGSQAWGGDGTFAGGKASIDGPTGSASFAGAVNVGNDVGAPNPTEKGISLTSGGELYLSRPNTSGLIYGYRAGEAGVKFQLNNDGTASFGGDVTVGDAANANVSISKNGAIYANYKFGGASTDIIRIKSGTSLENTVFTVDQYGAASFAGGDVVINEPGNAGGKVNIDSTSDGGNSAWGLSVKNNDSRTGRATLKLQNAGDANAIEISNAGGTATTTTITSSGSATFAGALEAASIDGGTY